MGTRSRSAWVGALALGLSVAVMPAAAARAADDGSVSEVQFKLPNRAAIDELNDLGADLLHSVTPGPDGSVYVAAIVTEEEKALYAARGYEPIQTLADESDWKRVTDEADAADAAQAAAFANLEAGHAVANAKGKSLAAADSVHVNRADYFENYAGRFISIEAHTTDGVAATASAYSGPVLTAAWLDAAGAELGTGTLSGFVDASVYLYSRNLFRVGAVGDGGTMPKTVRVASANGGVAELKVTEWTSQSGKPNPAGMVQDFNTNYTDPQKAYTKMSDLATEFPNIAQVYNLPNKTNGYQRRAQAIVGTAAAFDPRLDSQSSAGSVATADQAKAVVVTSRAWGHEGGNDLSIEIAAPTAGNQTLKVAVAGNAITVTPATDAAGAITSTASDVVTAINNSQLANDLVFADKYNTNTGLGVVSATPVTKLSDFLKAPATYPRGPQTVKMLRIGKQRDGSKTGVFIYCQEHAREWATPLVCLETAERLVRNYATDPETKSLIDNLDIFIIPTINADGAAYSRYDFTSQRKNLRNYCTQPGSTAPTSRNSWGVDLNRNFSVGSVFDGFNGASATSCTSDTFAGPGEFSEPESRNEAWVQTSFPNIKFAMNVHSSGGYFMWPPGAYKTAGRELLPRASAGVNQYFESTARTVLDRIKSYRGTVIPPARTGPVADVLYSAAGNSADEAWYTHGIIGYDFEIGAQRFTPQAGGTAVGPLPDPGFTPTFAPEGHDEGMEFTNGNYALLASALEYEKDTAAPIVTAVGPDISATPFDVTFEQNEPAEIHYTTDGSAPTLSSPEYGPELVRGQPVPIHVGGTLTLRWIAKDLKGNISTGTRTFTIGTSQNGNVNGTVGPTLTLTLGTPASFGPFTPGVAKTYAATMAANVVSSAGDAALSIADGSTNVPGHLVNGAFGLAASVQAKAASAAGTGGGAFADVSATPLKLLSWTAPVSNDTVTVSFQQAIGANEALRTGTYGKALTFTLSTTTP